MSCVSVLADERFNGSNETTWTLLESKKKTHTHTRNTLNKIYKTHITHNEHIQERAHPYGRTLISNRMPNEESTLAHISCGMLCRRYLLVHAEWHTQQHQQQKERDFLYVFREDHNFGNSSSDTNVAASTRIFRRRAEVNLFLLKVSNISRTESVKLSVVCCLFFVPSFCLIKS